MFSHNIPAPMMNRYWPNKNSHVNRSALIFVTLLNAAFAMISVACTTVIVTSYVNLPGTPEDPWAPTADDFDSARDFGKDSLFQKRAVNQIRSINQKQPRKPLLVATGLFVVTGILILGLVWMFIEEKLDISRRFKIQRTKFKQFIRSRWPCCCGGSADETSEDANQGAQNAQGLELQEQAQRITNSNSQLLGVSSRGEQSEGDRTLADDVEAQPYILTPLTEANTMANRRKPPGSQGQGQGDQNPSQLTVAAPTEN